MKCFSCGDVHEWIGRPLDWTADHGIRTVQRSRSSLCSRPGILKLSHTSTLKMTVCTK